MTSLNRKHHILIQALLSRGPLKEEEFHSIFASITKKKPGNHQQLFNDWLLRINKELAYVQLELRGCINQYNEVYYGVVNNVGDERSKLGTKYSVPQIALYKAVIKAIVQDATAKGCISNISALLNIRLEDQIAQGGEPYVPSAFKKFTMLQKQNTLDKLVQDRWLCYLRDGNIGLGVRSFLDLRSWFHSNDVTSCVICNEAGVNADLCQNESCIVRIHRYCLKKQTLQRVEQLCPSCGNEWPCIVSEVEEDEGHDEQDTASQRQIATLLSRRKRRKTCKNTPSQSSVPYNLRSRTRSSTRVS